MAKQKEAWDKLSMLEKALLIKLSVDNGVSSLKLIRDTYNLYSEGGQKEVLDKVNSSNANFVQRLKDPNRKNIPDWESPTDRISTHKLSVGTDENGNHYIFPEVQEINGELIDFTRPPYHRFAGEISAEMRGDTVRVPSIEDGIKFTETYKLYYPLNNGGNLVHKFDGNSDTQYLRTLQPEVVMPVTGKTADTSWYEWWFANRQKQLQQNIETVKKNDRERDFTKYFITYPNAEEDTKRMIEALGKTKEYVGNAGMMEDPIGNSLARKVLASDIADYTPDISDDDVNSFLSYLQNGVHLPAYNSILYPGRWESPSKTTVTHERAHAADAFFPRKAINYFTTAGEVNPELYDTWYKRIFASLHPKHPLGIYPSSGRSNSYLDAPNEVYSRLMEFRQFVGANPNYTWTKDDLKKYEPALNKFELRRYSDDDILKLLNEIAQNNSGFQKSENTHLAAFGGNLSHKKSTGGPIIRTSSTGSGPIIAPFDAMSSYLAYPEEWADVGRLAYDVLRFFPATKLLTNILDTSGYSPSYDNSDFVNIQSIATDGIQSVGDALTGMGRVLDILDLVGGFTKPFSTIGFVGDVITSFNDLYLMGKKYYNKSKTETNNTKSTGGPLYPFSFEKNPFLKTPIVRYDEGGEMVNINLPEVTVFPEETYITYTGNESKSFIPTKKLYNEFRANEIRRQALVNMNNRNTPHVPYINDDPTKPGSSCLYTFLSNYPVPLEKSNRVFWELSPEESGFKRVDTPLPGDGIQVFSSPKPHRWGSYFWPAIHYDSRLKHGYKFPSHMTMFKDIDTSGVLIRGSNGSTNPFDTSAIIEERKPINYIYPENIDIYRFIGTQLQLKDWEKEYNNIYKHGNN